MVSLASAKNCADACGQLPGRKRLDDVVIGPDLKPHDAVQFLSPGGQHDDWKVGVLTNSPREVSSVSVGEHDVQEDQIRRTSDEGIVRLGDAAGHFRVKTLPCEMRHKGFRDRLLVLYEQDAWFHS